jgi:hypothetical protein
LDSSDLRLRFTSEWVCVFDLEQVDAKTAMKEIPNLHPAEEKSVKMPEIVSVSAISSR